MRRFVRAAVVVVVLGGLVALLLSPACSVLPARFVDAPPPAPALVRDPWPGCRSLGAFRDSATSNDLTGKGRLPDGFVPVDALVCATLPVDGPNGTGPQVGLERTAPVTRALLDYLARPSQRATNSNYACPAMAQQVPWLFLRDADGRWITPQVPTDACGFTLDTFSGGVQPLSLLSYTDRTICRWSTSGDRSTCR